jgi:hypothetical protein
MMQRQCSCSAVLIIVIGCILALMSAFVPHYSSYLLMISVLLAGISPYLVYAVAMPFLRTSLLIIPGLLLIVAHGWLVLIYRFAQPVDYSDHWIYYGPLLLAAGLLPLAVCAMRVPYTGRIAPKADAQPRSEQEKIADTDQ